MTSRRLDEALVARGLYATRSRARDAVSRGTVWVNGSPARKPAQPVTDKDQLSTSDPAQNYVSRAALKLVQALTHFEIVVHGRQALDIGASTGGFTQVLLEWGAVQVTAIDVGHGQMAPHLAKDPRVMLYEGVNARDLQPGHVHGDTSLVVCDVSFISLKLILPHVLQLITRQAHLVALIKPQFEVGREQVGKGGIVTDHAEQQRICDEISALVSSLGWRVKGIIPSPLAGGDGNQEFLLHAVKPN